ncbi:MAG: 1-acyl-sn-glycerol-3-phosphate acyltransferase [Gallionellaceae bacterium]|jgi:1-acyl-sn-glycerol-3-phosphate acyltransferase|nr:1-acyl-sn-glycerol-3-phosphate acyltransferase [Gallionellaceae bacterium]
MIFLRSLLFFLMQCLFAVLVGVSALLTFWLPPLLRYRLVSCWALSMMWFMRVLCGIRLEVRGAENIPAEPCIILCKHQSTWETIALQKVFPPQVWVLKRELLWIPFFGWGLALTSPIAIDRSNGKEAMRQLLAEGKDRLAKGFCVVIFPEGTRVPYGQRVQYKVGGALLGAHCGVPVVPVAHNAGKFWARHSFLKHPGTITMSIGAAISPEGLKASEINQRVENWIEAEVERIG